MVGVLVLLRNLWSRAQMHDLFDFDRSALGSSYVDVASFITFLGHFY